MKKLWAIVLLPLIGLGQAFQVEAETVDKEIVVYRSPTCGCCGKWIRHLQDEHFKVIDNVVNDMDSIKKKYGVPAELASCHTAIIGGYVIEGHVPAEDIDKLMSLKPDIMGIAVPGMPVGTPGMEMGGRKDSFKVIAFDKEQRRQIFSAHD
ncbi:MAG: DUF411 domain-containing protein [Methylomicrobium sp.]